MTGKIVFAALSLILLQVLPCRGEQLKQQEFLGVVTLQLLPAKVMKINNIVEEPKPGTSYIGNEGILVEVDENPDVMANWTVVKVGYYKYPEPKIIRYQLFSQQQQVTVPYHAVSVEIDGDLSRYIQQE